jgi:hypothetical protein
MVNFEIESDLTQYGDENSEFVDEARNEIQSLSLH